MITQQLAKKLDQGGAVKNVQGPVEERRGRQRKHSIEDGKKVERLRTEAPACCQDAVEIGRIHPDGIFEIAPGVFTKSYYFFFGPFWMLSDDQKIILADLDTKLRTGMGADIQYTYIKRPLISDSLMDRAHIPEEEHPELAAALNTLIREKHTVSTEGLETLKLITLTVRKKSFETARAALIAQEEKLRRDITNTGSRISPLGSNERLMVFRDFYQRGNLRPFLYQYPDKRGRYNDFRNDIAPQLFEQHPDHIRIGEHTYIRVIYAAAYEQELEDDLTNSILSQPCEMVFSVNQTEIPRDAVKKRVDDIHFNIGRRKQKEQDNNNKNGHYSQGFSWNLMQAEEKAAKFSRECAGKMVFQSATIAIIADSLEELNLSTENLLSEGEEKGIRFEIQMNLQREGLNTALPHGVRYTRTMRSLNATAAFCLHPYWSTEIMENGVWYGNNRITHNPIIIDRRNLDNPHMLVFGSSGGAKSGETKLEMEQVRLKRMGNIIIFDPTGEYKPVVEKDGGIYVEISMKSGIHINPLEIPHAGVSQDDFIAKKGALLTEILRTMKNDCSSNHTSILDTAVKSLYNEYFSFWKQMRKKQPILKDLIRHVRKAPQRISAELGVQLTTDTLQMYEKTAEEICMALSVLTDGTLSFFSQESNLNIWDNPMVGVGFADVPGTLYDVATTIFMDYVETIAAINLAKGIDTYFYLDELHETIKSSLVANYLTTKWKTARHSGLILTGILQDITDIKDHPACKQLLTNSSSVIIMKQQASNIPLVVEACGISEAEADYVSGCLQGTGVCKFGNAVLPFDARVPENLQKGVLWDILNTDTVNKQHWGRM